ncbi:hypothetical protein NLG97_g2413 [Lecanicillium saksenae]|uniref:Uncharacterized protein n=1 Tax=Lecanicillium saksenae TaxID=468837 RepID=A0ACC1R288_9HYPO|nr:hypothetical protein NLG97_g2413 [Lecanicillium saksenae]
MPSRNAVFVGADLGSSGFSLARAGGTVTPGSVGRAELASFDSNFTDGYQRRFRYPTGLVIYTNDTNVKVEALGFRDPARLLRGVDGARCIFTIKLIVGKRYKSAEAQKDARFLRTVGLDPWDCLVVLLRAARKSLGEESAVLADVDTLSITLPGMYTQGDAASVEMQKQMAIAYKKSGFPGDIAFEAESDAALSHCLTKNGLADTLEGRLVLFVDFGGSTADFTFAEIRDGTVTRLAPSVSAEAGTIFLWEYLIQCCKRIVGDDHDESQDVQDLYKSARAHLEAGEADKFVKFKWCIKKKHFTEMISSAFREGIQTLAVFIKRHARRVSPECAPLLIVAGAAMQNDRIRRHIRREATMILNREYGCVAQQSIMILEGEYAATGVCRGAAQPYNYSDEAAWKTLVGAALAVRCRPVGVGNRQPRELERQGGLALVKTNGQDLNSFIWQRLTVDDPSSFRFELYAIMPKCLGKCLHIGGEQFYREAMGITLDVLQLKFPEGFVRRRDEVWVRLWRRSSLRPADLVLQLLVQEAHVKGDRPPQSFAATLPGAMEMKCKLVRYRTRIALIPAEKYDAQMSVTEQDAYDSPVEEGKECLSASGERRVGEGEDYSSDRSEEDDIYDVPDDDEEEDDIYDVPVDDEEQEVCYGTWKEEGGSTKIAGTMSLAAKVMIAMGAVKRPSSDDDSGLAGKRRRVS